jgi:hypothetical protein
VCRPVYACLRRKRIVTRLGNFRYSVTRYGTGCHLKVLCSGVLSGVRISLSSTRIKGSGAVCLRTGSMCLSIIMRKWIWNTKHARLGAPLGIDPNQQTSRWQRVIHSPVARARRTARNQLRQQARSRALEETPRRKRAVTSPSPGDLRNHSGRRPHCCRSDGGSH